MSPYPGTITGELVSDSPPFLVSFGMKTTGWCARSVCPGSCSIWISCRGKDVDELGLVTMAERRGWFSGRNDERNFVTGSKVRRRTFYGMAGLTTALLIVMLGFGLSFPVLAWLPDSTLFALMDDIEPDALAHRLHELVVGVFSWVLLLSVALQFRKPERKVAPLLQGLSIPVVLSVVEMVNGNFVLVETLPLLLPLLVLAVLHPAAGELIRPGRFDARLAGLTALAAVPWALFAVGQAGLQQLNITGDTHAEAGHWGLVSGFAVLLVVWGLIGASDRPGWRITALITAVSSVFYGAHSLLFPESASAAPIGWATAVIAWGAVYGVAAWRRERVGDVSEPRTSELGVSPG